MIRCQQCGFDNPDSHKFCQQCGSSLSDAVSGQEKMPSQEAAHSEDADSAHPDSDSSVEHGIADMSSRSNGAAAESESHLSEPSPETVSDIESEVESPADSADWVEENAQPSHTVWLAILFPSALNVFIPGMGDRSSQELSVDIPSCVAAVARVMGQRAFLSSQHRYQVLPPVSTLNVHSIDIEIKVRDCKPVKPTVIELWDDASLETELDLTLPTAFDSDGPLSSSFSEEETADINDIGDIDDTPARYEDFVASSRWLRDNKQERIQIDVTAPDADDSQLTQDDPQKTLPAIAQLYLMVQNQLYPSLPQIHNAWTEDDCAIIVLEDRSHLDSFVESLKQPNVLPIQILHWLHEMVELWAIVEPLCCRRSILELENLRVDEDQILCLKRLHLEIPTKEATLQDLGRVWKDLLEDLSVVAENGFTSLYQDLESGDITTLDELRERLESAADQIHDDMGTDESIQGATELSGEPSVQSLARSDTSNPARLTTDGSEETEMSWLSNSEVDESLNELYSDADEAPTIVLPMQVFSLMDAGSTDIGRQRDHNEDYFSINSVINKEDTPSGRTLSGKGLYILCDGMGGHAAGEVASALAVSTLQKHFESNWGDRLPNYDDIQTAIHKANQSIFELNQQNDRQGSGRMGTTLVMMLVQDTKVAIAHVGDSRIYRFGRRSGLEQLTVDHEVGQREIQRGVDPAIAYARPDAYQLTQALGPRGEKFINPDIHFFDVNEDVLFLLCSDGLSDNDFLEQHSASHIEPMLSSQTILEHELRRLIDLANQHNGHDNITAVSVRIKMRPKIQGM